MMSITLPDAPPMPPIGNTSDHAKQPSLPAGSTVQMGEKFAPTWGGVQERLWLKILGNHSLVQFDLNKLSLEDFRVMRDHYQINAVLSGMTFMLHQIDWHIECEDEKIKKHVQENMDAIWTPLVRGMSQAFWAGFSPLVLQWENDLNSNTVQLAKIKDIIPELARPHWLLVDGYAPPGWVKPRIPVYDGMWVWGQNWPVPKENTLWYSLLSENGDMFGRKLLRSAFTSWYFSILLHLFANRYFERFGEPVPIGRAPYDDVVTVDDGTGKPKTINGAVYMTQLLQNFRNRSVVVLPNDRSAESNSQTAAGTVDYEYNIEYLESQMRGADFERYMLRLDEEMSLALFTPLLVLRTGMSASYNLGTTHWTMYLNMLNALAGDMKTYIDKFVLSRMVDFNFGEKAPRATIFFRKMGNDQQATITAILQALIPTGTVKVDLEELGAIAGLTFTEVELLTAPPAGGLPDQGGSGAGGGSGSGSAGDGGDGDTAKPKAKPKSKTSKNSSPVFVEIAGRISGQILKAAKEETPKPLELSFGYERKLADALDLDGHINSHILVGKLYAMVGETLCEVPLESYSAFTQDSLTMRVSSLFEFLMEDV